MQPEQGRAEGGGEGGGGGAGGAATAAVLGGALFFFFFSFWIFLVRVCCNSRRERQRQTEVKQMAHFQRPSSPSPPLSPPLPLFLPFCLCPPHPASPRLGPPVPTKRNSSLFFFSFFFGNFAKKCPAHARSTKLKFQAFKKTQLTGERNLARKAKITNSKIPKMEVILNSFKSPEV